MDRFLQYWDSDDLLTFQRSTLEQLNINEEHINFLTEIGLPKDAAPFLTFENELKSLNEIYKLDEPELQTKIVIGSDGAGDPICIELTNQRIYACDHEDDFEPRFMNSDVVELFKFLSLIEEFNKRPLENEKDDFEFTDEELFELTTKMRLLDPKALEPETFWHEDIEEMKANREYYRNEKTGDNKH